MSSQERHPQIPKPEVKELFRTLRATGDQEIRTRLIEGHLGLVEYLARRFAGRGEPVDDLIQVATIGLVKAVDRFDPDREVEFSTYATPTIVGELKRHFRDKGWAVRAPRRMQELYLRLGKVIGILSQELGRSPTIQELAAEADVSEEEVLEAMEAGQAYRFTSLDAGGPGDDAGESLHTMLGEEDPATLTSLLIAHQRDGQGVWGRWNANGPGTARLFTELRLGRNFTDFAEARPSFLEAASAA